MAVFCEPGCGCKRHSWKKPPGWNEKIAKARRAGEAKRLDKLLHGLERRIKRRMEKIKQEGDDADTTS